MSLVARTRRRARPPTTRAGSLADAFRRPERRRRPSPFNAQRRGPRHQAHAPISHGSAADVLRRIELDLRQLGRVTARSSRRDRPDQVVRQDLAYFGNDDPKRSTTPWARARRHFQFSFDRRHQLARTVGNHHPRLLRRDLSLRHRAAASRAHRVHDGNATARQQRHAS